VVLDLSTIACLPLPAALFDRSGLQLAATPEWTGPTVGSVGYAFEGMRLAVASRGAQGRLADIAGAVVVARLVDTLRSSSDRVDQSTCRRLLFLAEGLQVLTGRAAITSGTTDDVFAYLDAVLPARTDLPVTFHPGTATTVPAPASIANAVLQLLINAAEHSGAQQIDVYSYAPFGAASFRLQWQGQPPPPEGQLLNTSRLQHRTAGRGARGTGMVAARVIADAVGARILGPLPGIDARTGVPDADSTRIQFDLGSRALALPLATARDGAVAWANTAWLEERLPGRGCPLKGSLDDLVHVARQRRGEIVADGGVAARAAGADTWLAQPPDDTAERALLAARYVEHERALCAVGPPHEQRARSLATFLTFVCGDDLPFVTADTWNELIAQECAAYGRSPGPVQFEGERILDPMLSAFLICDVGDDILERDGRVLVTVRPELLADPFVRLLSVDGTTLDLCASGD
jgi:hypothetical protein